MSISLSGSLVITGSIVASGGITGSFSGSATTSSYALTASSVNPLTQSLSVSGSITATGILTAQTLVVQTITSSIVYSSGSNIFGNQLTNVQQMTGSVNITGSTNLTGTLSGTSATFSGNANAVTLNAATGTTNTQFKVANTSGDNYFGVAASDGSSLFTGTTAYSAYLGTNNARSLHLVTNGIVRQTIDLSGNVGIGTSSPAKTLDIYSTVTSNTAQIVVSDTGSTNRLYLGTFSNGSYISLGGTYQSGWIANGSNAIANIGMSATNGASTIQFETSTTNGVGPTERMRITASGSVGIGTITPTNGKLEVQTGATTAGLWVQTGGTTTGYTIADFRTGTNLSALQILGNGAATFGSSVAATTFGSTIGNDNFVFDTYGATTGYLSSRIKNSSGSLIMGTEGSAPGNVATGDLAYSSGIYTGTTRALHFGVDQTVAMTIINGSNIGMGTTTPAYRLQLSTDSAAKPSTNTWTISSDIRVKENINPYTKGLETILKINPVTYDYNGKAGFEKIKNNIGIIAQDVLDILPESISTYKVKLDDNDNEESELYNFNSHALTYVLINAIQEQQATITSLQEQINELKNK